LRSPGEHKSTIEVASAAGDNAGVEHAPAVAERVDAGLPVNGTAKIVGYGPATSTAANYPISSDGVGDQPNVSEAAGPAADRRNRGPTKNGPAIRRVCVAASTGADLKGLTDCAGVGRARVAAGIGESLHK